MQRRGLFWYFESGEAVPWWLGFVRHCELHIQYAPIGINLLCSWGGLFLDAIRYRLAPRARRKELQSPLVLAAYERGREAGILQGLEIAKKAIALFDEDAVQ